MLPVTQIDTFYNGLTLRHRDTINAAAGGTFMKRRPEECYDLIENMTAHHNEWDTSIQRSESSSSITSSSDLEIIALKAEMAEINKNLMKVLQINQQVKAVSHNCKTSGGPYFYNDCLATVGQTQNVYAGEPIIKVVILTNLKETVICVAIVQPTISDPQGLIRIKTEAIQIRTTKIRIGIKETTMEMLRGTTKEETNSSKELVMVKARLQLIKHRLIKPRLIKPWTNDAILKDMPTNMTSLTNSNLELKNMYGQFMKMNTASSSGSGTLLSNTITNPKEDLKGITTRSGNAYQGPMILTTSSPPKVVERETKLTNDTMPPTNNRSTKDVQPLVVQVKTPIPNSEPVVAPVVETVESPVSAPKPNPKPSIPYPYRLHDQKLCDKANDRKEKFFQIFQELNFNISFADALILMPKFGPNIKSLLTNKEKLFELAITPLNEHCSAVLLKKLPEKVGDPGKFLIPRNFPGMDQCLALADLGTSINLMPLSGWNKLSLPELSPTCMTLELVDRSISRLVGVAENVFVKVGTFHFPGKFVVVDFDVDPRVPLILGRSFLNTGLNRIDLIDVVCEEYSQEVFGFSVSGNPTPSKEPIVSISSPTFTSFGDNDFLLEETDAFLAIDDEPISSKIDDSFYDLWGDILLLEEFLNDDLSSPPFPPQELKGDDKLLVIIAKDIKDEEKTALIKVLKSHKQALAWQLSDIKGIYLEFCTHKILMVDDFKSVVQHQRKVNPKIHELNETTCKDHFPLPFMDQMLERLAGNEYYFFLDGFSGYFQIPIDPQDQENTIFTCPYGTFAYGRMPFSICTAPSTFQRCMMAIFHDMIEKTMEVFMNDFSVFGNSFETCLSHLDKILKR
nr:reverse transcriptase domain-containing protein [Tanacetum cinerariifolium]